jgi:hypothetical protein
MRPIHLSRVATLAGIGLALAVTLSTAGAALAGGLPAPPPPSSTGKVGPNSLARMSMIAPRVRAASGRTSQKVTWRLVVQSWDATRDRWTAYARSPWTAATAKPRVPAPLASRTVRLRTYDDPEDATSGWRGKAEIRWFAKNGTTIVGRAVIHPRWYLVREGALPTYTWLAPLCGWTTG